jgi:hypothetical protein
MQNMQNKQDNMRANKCQPQRSCPTFLICVGILELIIAIIASTGLGLNVLAKSNGVADVQLVNTSSTIGKYYAHVDMKTKGYQFYGHYQNSTTTNSKYYSYKSAYEDKCGNGKPVVSSDKHETSGLNCDTRYGIWQWSRAYTGLGVTAVVLAFLTGIVLLFLGCCGELLKLLCCCCCCGKDECDKPGCCGSLIECLFACAAEWWLVILNFIMFILFAFSWAIILGLKFNTHLKNLLASEANEALNNHKNAETYNFHFGSISVGRSLWPLAVASFMSLVLSLYLMIILCCGCCRNCEGCEDKMRCNCDKDNDKRMSSGNNNNMYGNNNQRPTQRNSTIEMASDEVQV